MVFGGLSIGYTQQHCQADIVIEPHLDEKTVKIILSNIGKVFCTTVENDDVVTDEYQRLDSTSINLALVGNATVLMKMDVFTYEVFSASNDNKDIHSFIARATGSQPGGGLVGLFKGASVTVTMYGFDHECDYLDHGCNDHRFYKDTNSEFVSIDSNSGDLFLHFQHETPIPILPYPNTLFIIEGNRAGSNKLETMVAYIHRICVDGKRIKLRLSKKGLKSKGCAAKKAIDGFTSGVYKIQSMYPVQPSSLFGAQIPTHNGVLKKTAEDGTFNLEFKTIASYRLYEVYPATKMVSSIGVDSYLEKVAQSISDPHLISAADLPEPENKLLTVTMFEEGAGAGFAGFIEGFITKWSQNAKGYTATVKLTFHDAKKLGEETFIGIFIINSASIRFGERRVGENFDNIFLGGRDLRVVDFTNSTFRFANLTSAILINTFFFNAILTNATLTNANLYRAVLQLANLTNANLTNANLTNADLRNANLRNANLTRADLRGAIFNNETDLRGANFDGANLSGVIFNGANLSGAINFRTANISGANLSGVNLSNTYLVRVYFSGLNLSRANLTRANLQSALLNSANLTGANFTNADIRRADLTEAFTAGAIFTGAQRT